MGTPPPPTPPGWYPNPAGGGGQRYWDGTRWTEHQTSQPPAGFPPPPATADLPLWMRSRTVKRRKVWPWIVGGVVAFVVIVAAFSGGGDKGSRSSSTGSAPSTTSSFGRAQASTQAAPAPPTVAGIGQPVRDGKFEFVVTGVSTAKTVGDPSNQFMQATAQGVYVVVSMTVRNIGDQSQSFFAANQKLQDTAGREFSPRGYAC